jgi:hypothetical protein
MQSEGPLVALAPIITAVAAAASAGAGIYSATAKPDTPGAPKPQPNAGAISAARQRAAGASGRQSTILTSQKLGSVGQ